MTYSACAPASNYTERPDYTRVFKGSRLRVCLVREGRSKKTVYVRSPADVYDIVKRQLCKSDREVFLSILLSTDGSLIGIETVAVGTLDFCAVTPRELFKSAILGNARTVILCHCHPSGNTALSTDDRKLSQTMAAAGKLLGIPVADHIVVSHTGYTSHREDEPAVFG